MQLTFAVNRSIRPAWIDGPLPNGLRLKRTPRVKVDLSGKSDSHFPRSMMPIGDLLCSERPKPKLQHGAMLLLSYPHSITTSPAVQGEDGWWTVPGSTEWGQIRIALSPEAIALIRQVEADDHDFELKLKDVELVGVKANWMSA
jgi:hypothetical protein